jgi:hypothetical protein
VTSDVVSTEALRELVGWRYRDGIDLCLVCLWRRDMAPGFADRLAVRRRGIGFSRCDNSPGLG